MTEVELQCLVEEVSVKFFNRSFRHEASFNKRLKTTGGRYHLQSHNLDFNPLLVELYGKDELIKVIKHELCHYHLHLSGNGYQHKDASFKRLLAEVGGSRFAPPLVARKKSLQYVCQSCGQGYQRQRKINTKKFVCGKCQGKLTLVE